MPETIIHVPNFSSLRLIPVFFSNCVLCSRFFFHDSGKQFLWNAPTIGKETRPYSRSLPIFFHLTHLVTNTTCSIQKGPSVRLRFARIFIFHFNLHFSRHTSTRKLGHSDTRAEFIQQVHTIGRREFTSAGRRLDGSCAAKLFSSNYYRPPSNDVPASSDAILKIFSKI